MCSQPCQRGGFRGEAPQLQTGIAHHKAAASGHRDRPGRWRGLDTEHGGPSRCWGRGDSAKGRRGPGSGWRRDILGFKARVLAQHLLGHSSQAAWSESWIPHPSRGSFVHRVVKRVESQGLAPRMSLWGAGASPRWGLGPAASSPSIWVEDAPEPLPPE